MSAAAPVSRAVVALISLAGAALAAAWYGAQERRDKALQRAFIAFHENIRHERFGEQELLRSRRDALSAELKVLADGVRTRTFDQGSYSMGTGVKPLAGEFDIDIGLVLDCETTYFKDPVEAKLLVRDALKRGSRRLRVRRSCITVYYTQKDYGDFHVDLAVYARGKDGRLHLAKGKPRSDEENRVWEPAAPEELTKLVDEKASGEERAQFKRCIRYLKRWKHVNFKTKAPFSIALTMAAFHWFEPRLEGLVNATANDTDAMRALVQKMLTLMGHGRLHVQLPVAPSVDLMEGMTPKQMSDFRLKLERLRDALTLASEAEDTDVAVRALRNQFGAEFGGALA